MRIPHETYMELIQKDNYSEWIRNAIGIQLEKEHDPKFIDSKIKEHEREIKHLKELKKGKPINQDKINELLNNHAPAYKKQAPFRSENQRWSFIKRSILPQLKKTGYKGTPAEIDELLLNWPEGD